MRDYKRNPTHWSSYASVHRIFPFLPSRYPIHVHRISIAFYPPYRYQTSSIMLLEMTVATTILGAKYD
jgi:hypothetical protein